MQPSHKSVAKVLLLLNIKALAIYTCIQKITLKFLMNFWF